MIEHRAECGPLKLAIVPDKEDMIPDTWRVKVIIAAGKGCLYINKTVGEQDAKDAAVGLARYGCRDQGIPEPAGLDDLQWEPIA